MKGVEGILLGEYQNLILCAGLKLTMKTQKV